MDGIIIEALIEDKDHSVRWISDKPVNLVSAVQTAFRLGQNPTVKEIRIKERLQHENIPETEQSRRRVPD